MRRRTALNCIAKRSVTYADYIPLSLCACVYIGETERGCGDVENILIHVHVTIQHRHEIANSHSHLLLGLRGLSVYLVLPKHIQMLIPGLLAFLHVNIPSCLACTPISWEASDVLTWVNKMKMTLPHTLSLESTKNYSSLHTNNYSSLYLPPLVIQSGGSNFRCSASLHFGISPVGAPRAAKRNDLFEIHQFYLLVPHYTDTHVYVFSYLSLYLFIINKSDCGDWKKFLYHGEWSPSICPWRPRQEFRRISDNLHPPRCDVCVSCHGRCCRCVKHTPHLLYTHVVK